MADHGSIVARPGCHDLDGVIRAIAVEAVQTAGGTQAEDGTVTSEIEGRTASTAPGEWVIAEPMDPTPDRNEDAAPPKSAERRGAHTRLGSERGGDDAVALRPERSNRCLCEPHKSFMSFQ